MEYFILSQDKRYRRVPIMQDVFEKFNKPISKVLMEEIPATNIMLINAPDKQDFLDVLDEQLFLISKLTKSVFELYDPLIGYKLVMLLNNENDEYGEYYVPIVRKVNCISPKSEFNKDKSAISKLVIQFESVKYYSIFSVENAPRNTIIARLDVVESLLRRKLIGFNIQKVEVE